MTQALATLDDNTMFHLVAGGDCSKLNNQQKLAYYKARCDAVGLDPRTHPFEFTNMNGRTVLYAKKEATNQLASKHKIALKILSQETDNGIRVVTVSARAADGRETEEIGAVTVQNLKGDALCNAYMKATTKAKRRAILSLCGLGMSDETELETIPGAVPAKKPSRLAAVVEKALPQTTVNSDVHTTGAVTTTTEPVTTEEIGEAFAPAEEKPKPKPKKKRVVKKKAKPAPAPEPVEEPEPEEQEIDWDVQQELLVKRIASKSGTSAAGKEWTRFGVLFAGPEGEFWGNTFSDTIAEDAKRALDNTYAVIAEFEENNFGKNITSLTVIEPGEDEEEVPL